MKIFLLQCNLRTSNVKSNIWRGREGEREREREFGVRCRQQGERDRNMRGKILKEMISNYVKRVKILTGKFKIIVSLKQQEMGFVDFK